MEESAKVLGQAFMESYPHPLLGRMPTGEEQAWSLLLLSSPLNAAVTGAVLATRLIHSMRRDGLRRGIVTLCIGGGQGIALAIEMIT